MITEIVTFDISKDLSREDVIAMYERSVPNWKATPHLIHKSFLFDPEAGVGGGVYLWETIDAAKRSHDQAFRNRIREAFGGMPKCVYYESPVVINNHSGDVAAA
jgi:hypothetical protein